MPLIIVISAFSAVLSFTAGFFISKAINKEPEPVKKMVEKFENVIMEQFSSLTSLLNFDEFLQSIFNIIIQTGLFRKIMILRYDGVILKDFINNRLIGDERIISFFQKYSGIENVENTSDCRIYEEYYECIPFSSVFYLINSEQISVNQAKVYPINFDFIGVHYFFILFYKYKNINKTFDKFILFIKRQLFLVLYLEETSTKYKENFEFLDGVFYKNPVAMCVTDDDGKIVKPNKGIGNLFSRELINIKQLIEEDTFLRIMSGQTEEKDFYFQNKNLKVRGIPFYSNTGQIRGCLFTILDDSLQHLLFNKLKASEERYKKLLKELPIGLVIVNQEGSIYLVNDNFISLLDFADSEKLLGKYLQEFFDIPYSDFKDIAMKIEDRSTLFFKFQLKHKYGNRIFSVHLQRILIGEDELIEAIFQDVSLENRLYVQLDEKTKMIEEELATAKRIWEHILSIPPIYTSLIRFETFFKPSSQLGGDFYDIIQIDDVHVGIIIADVSGHGVSASLITSMLKMIIEFAPKDPHRIDDMISYLNMLILKVLPEDQYITLFFGIIDTRNYTIQYINCGHPFPLVFDDKNNTIEVLKGLTFPLGTKRNISYSEIMRKVQLPESCKLLFYTDGLLTFKKPDRLIKIEDLIEIFEKSVFLQTKDILTDMYMKILKSSSQFTDDDVSMLLIILNKKLALKKHLSIPSNVLEIDNAIVKIMESITISNIINLEEEDKWKLYTALYEAIINAVEHGNKFNVQRRVTIIYRIIANWIVFKVRDEGIGFKVNELPNPLDDNNILKPSGRGVYMIKKLMNKVKHNKSGNEVTMFLCLSNNSPEE